MKDYNNSVIISCLCVLLIGIIGWLGIAYGDEYFQKGKEAYDKKDYKTAVQFYKKACELKEGIGCSHLGFLYANGLGVKQDYNEAVRLYKKACELKAGSGCSNLGVMYKDGQGVKQDYNEAARLYKKACEWGTGLGCYNLGVMYYQGLGVKQDYNEAVRLYKKACEWGIGLGCNNLGIMYEDGRGVKQDYSEAARLYKKACELKAGSGCSNLGLMYYQGLGVKQDYNEAVRLYRKACEWGIGLGCYNVGLFYKKGQGVKRDYDKAAQFYQKACKLGEKDGCIDFVKIGNLYEMGFLVKKNYKKAEKIYKIACDLGWGKGCTDLGLFYEKGHDANGEHDPKKAFKFYKKACELNNAMGCHFLATFYEKGKDNVVKQSCEKAKKFYSKACKLGDTSACNAGLLCPLYASGLNAKIAEHCLGVIEKNGTYKKIAINDSQCKKDIILFRSLLEKDVFWEKLPKIIHHFSNQLDSIFYSPYPEIGVEIANQYFDYLLKHPQIDITPIIIYLKYLCEPSRSTSFGTFGTGHDSYVEIHPFKKDFNPQRCTNFKDRILQLTNKKRIPTELSNSLLETLYFYQKNAVKLKEICNSMKSDSEDYFECYGDVIKIFYYQKDLDSMKELCSLFEQKNSFFIRRACYDLIYLEHPWLKDFVNLFPTSYSSSYHYENGIITRKYGAFTFIYAENDYRNIRIDGNFKLSVNSQIAAAATKYGITVSPSFDFSIALVRYLMDNIPERYFSGWDFYKKGKTEQDKYIGKFTVIVYALVNTINAGDIKTLNLIIDDFVKNKLTN